MSLITLIILAVGLAMDAFAVSITNGLAIKNIKIKDACKIATFFGGFQGLMPIIGWLLGKSFSDFMNGFDHWVVFGILLIIGVKMIYEALKNEEHAELSDRNLSLKTLLFLAVATSIDALAIGVSFSLMKVAIIFPAIVIGIITFFISFIGVYIGKKLGSLFGRRMEIIGGLILIAIGIKVFLGN